VSGGSANTQYLIGGTYHRETTVFPGNFDDVRASLHFNLMTQSSNNKFKFQLTGNYLTENNQLPGGDYTGVAFKLAPDAPALYNPDGSLNWALDRNGNTTWIIPSGVPTNPISSIYQKYTNKNNNLVSDAVLGYLILPGLEIKSSFGYTSQWVNESTIRPLISLVPATRPFAIRSASYSRNYSNSWIIEPQLAYKKNLDKGIFDALIGATIQQQNTDVLNIAGSGYNSDLVLQDPGSAGSTTASSSNSEYKYNALFARLGYNWNDKYIIDLTGRRDGTSRFGPQNQFHDFGSAAVGWIFTNENIFKDHLSLLSYGKVRASYGNTGSDQIGNYAFLSLYYPMSGYIPYDGTVSVAPNQLTNSYLQWEETKNSQLDRS